MSNKNPAIWIYRTNSSTALWHQIRELGHSKFLKSRCFIKRWKSIGNILFKKKKLKKKKKKEEKIKKQLTGWRTRLCHRECKGTNTKHTEMNTKHPRALWSRTFGCFVFIAITQIILTQDGFNNSQLNPRAGSPCWRQNWPHWALFVTSPFPALTPQCPRNNLHWRQTSHNLHRDLHVLPKSKQ